MTATENDIQALHAAYNTARNNLLASAIAFSQRLSARVTAHDGDRSFSVMFGDESSHGCSFAGPGLVELRVELSYDRVRTLEDLASIKPSLRFTPRAYSLGTDATLESCEAQGAALVAAAQFGRTLLALLA